MRRTPDFLEVKNHAVFNIDLFIRPDNEVGDHLENRRILRAIQDKFHFEELEGIIDDDETLEALYLFDGTRFMKERVLNLFDDSEYSFYTMFSALMKNAFEALEVNYGIKGSGALLEDASDAKYVLSLCEFIEFWDKGNHSLGLTHYAADLYYHGRFYMELNTSVRKRYQVGRGWSSHVGVAAWLLSGWRSPGNLVKNKWNAARNLLLLSRGVKAMQSPSVGDYVMCLSSCLNLPDDKHAEPGEKVLIEEWLRRFEAFYPEYEKLKAWYIKEKENTAGITA